MSERDEQIEAMHRASQAFYRAAVAIGVHPFIEITGFMNELIKVLARVPPDERYGIDAHGDKPLPMAPYEAAYFGEKFGCIFGPTFRKSPELWQAFVLAAEMYREG